MGQSFLCFLILASGVIITLLTAAKRRKVEAHKRFFTLFLLFSIWSLCWFALHHTRDAEKVKIWMNLWQTTNVFLPYALLAFTLSFLHQRSLLNSTLAFVAFMVGVVSCACVWMQKFWSKSIEVWGCFYPLSTRWSDTFFAFFAASIFYSIYLVWQRYKIIKYTNEAQQLRCLLAALSCAAAGGVANMCISHSFLHFPISYTPFLLALFCIMYGIFKHRLLEIHVVVRRSLVYTGLTIAITTIFLCTILLFERLFREVAGYRSFLPTLIAASAIATIFEPLYKRTQYFVDRIFFRARILKERKLQEFIKELSLIYDREKLFSSIIDCLCYVVPTEYAYIMLLDEERKEYRVVHAKGIQTRKKERLYLNSDRVLPRFLQTHKRELLSDEIKKASTLPEVRKKLEEDMNFLSAHCVWPLLHKERLIAIICCGPKKFGESYDEDDLHFLSFLCTESSMAIENIRLHEEMVAHFMHAVESLTHAVEAKDPYTFGHSERVAKYASAIAAELGLFEETQEAIRRGGALHDIGKIGVDEKILSKPGRLTEEEFAQIKLHPTIGVKILLPLRFPQEVIDGVQYHHERMDGSGYPEGRKGNEIPLSAKILAVCDAFEAMTSDRPYRKALLLQDAEQELRKSAGIWFDAKIVETFLNMVKEKKNFLEKRA